ncbi:MAG: hypothetical protein NC293_13620 [Roseburia sp.]|nr:hypothetical protein [Roseburia sp.]
MKRYTESELLKMNESRMNKLFETGKMGDDDAQRWYDLRAEAEYLANEFIKNELGIWA